MKRILSFGIALAMLVAFSGIASAATIIEKWADAKGSYPGSTVSHDVDPSNRNAGGIVWSRHNLSAYGEHYKAILTAAASVGTRTDSRIEIKASLTGSQGEVLGTTQICLFCHTSHHSTAQTGPLWNRNATGTYTAYSKYGPGTIAGTTTGPSGLQAENVYGGSSLACLSCHDGVTEMDNIINAPGNGSRTDGTNGDQEWVFLENDMVGGGAMRAAEMPRRGPLLVRTSQTTTR